MKLFTFILLLSAYSFAGDLGPEQKFLVKSVDGTDLNSLAGPQVKVLPAHRKVANSSNLPSVADRDRIFSASGLEPQIKDWDDFEKDSLYLKLQRKGSKTIERVLVKHPDLKRESLEKAQELIAKEENQ